MQTRNRRVAESPSRRIAESQDRHVAPDAADTDAVNATGITPGDTRLPFNLTHPPCTLVHAIAARMPSQPESRRNPEAVTT